MVANSSGSFLRCSNFLPEDEEAALGVTNCCFSIGLIVDICLFKTTAVEHLRAAKRRCGSLSAALLVPVNVCRSECATLFQPLFLLSRTSVTGPSFTSWMFM